MKRRPLPQGLYGPNPEGVLFGQVEKRHLERKGDPGPQRIAEYRGQHGGRCFSETQGTFFYRLRTPRSKGLDALAMVAEHGGIRATARATGIDKDTRQPWVARAGQHAAEGSASLLRERPLSAVPLDELWTFVKKRRATQRKRGAASGRGLFHRALREPRHPIAAGFPGRQV